MLQAPSTFLAITLPQPLRLSVAHAQQRHRIRNSQLPALYSAQHFYSPQFLLAHLRPPQSDLLFEVVLRGHFYFGVKGTLLSWRNSGIARSRIPRSGCPAQPSIAL